MRVSGDGTIVADYPLTGDPNQDSGEASATAVTDAAYNTIRPVICLKKGVKAVKSNDGTWNLSI